MESFRNVRRTVDSPFEPLLLPSDVIHSAETKRDLTTANSVSCLDFAYPLSQFLTAFPYLCFVDGHQK
jgi:hypothetical protein